MFFTNYFFKKNTTKEEDTTSLSLKKKQKKTSVTKVYLVINKNTQMPLGIFDTLEQAKFSGEKSTYYNCSILEFILNDKCSYLNTPVFENK
jgi:hypothetical protein